MAILSPASIFTPPPPQPPQAFQSIKNSTYLVSLCFLFHPCRPFLSLRLNPNARIFRLHAALSPQPPEQPDPPPGKDPVTGKGIAATLSRFQDRVQIFFAVLFWMSLFFWASASDGNNNGSGRPNKGSRFRR